MKSFSKKDVKKEESKKGSLKKLIDLLDWETLYTSNRGTYNKLATDQVSVQFFFKYKEKNPSPYVTIRIGKDVLQEMNLVGGDRIVPYYPKDDQMLFMLIKTDSSNGYKLTQETGSHACRFSFKWNRDIPLQEMRPKIVEHEIHKQKLIFRV